MWEHCRIPRYRTTTILIRAWGGKRVLQSSCRSEARICCTRATLNFRRPRANKSRAASSRRHDLGSDMGPDAVHHSSRCMNAAAAILGLLAISLYPSPARSAEFSEDVVKAAYLYRFAGYIQWPQRVSPETPFTIDVLGAPGIAREL